MKKTLTLAALFSGAVGVFAQGQIQFQDYVANESPYAQDFTITVWQPQGDGTTQVFGNTANDVPGGSQTYTGAAIGGGTVGSGPTDYGNGADYSIALYAAPNSGSTPLAFSQLSAVPGAVATFDTSGGSTPSAGFQGQWDATSFNYVTVPGVAAGAQGTFALAVWYNAGGTISFAQASALGSGDPYGISAPVNITLNSSGAPVPASLYPLTSFSLLANTPVPEPGTIALGVIGASALLFRIRRRN